MGRKSRLNWRETGRVERRLRMTCGHYRGGSDDTLAQPALLLQATFLLARCSGVAGASTPQCVLPAQEAQRFAFGAQPG